MTSTTLYKQQIDSPEHPSTMVCREVSLRSHCLLLSAQVENTSGVKNTPIFNGALLTYLQRIIPSMNLFSNI